jgi:hypothetical protein
MVLRVSTVSTALIFWPTLGLQQPRCRPDIADRRPETLPLSGAAPALL